jgi:hypothetical protein
VYLSRKLAELQLRGTCVVDRDLDTIEDNTHGNANLVKTDYSCMEMYGLLDADLNAFVLATFNVTLSSDNLSAIFDACKQLFVIRYLREKYCVGASLPDAAEIVKYDEKGVAILTDTYLGRCRQVNGYDARWDKVANEWADRVGKLGNERRDYINIHDMGSVLAKVIRTMKKKSVAIDFHFLEKHCVYVVISRALYTDPMFKLIEAKLLCP